MDWVTEVHLKYIFWNSECKHICVKCLLCAYPVLVNKAVKKSREVLAFSKLKFEGYGWLNYCFPLCGPFSYPGPPTQTERTFPFFGHEAGHVACFWPMGCEQMLPTWVWKAGLPCVFSSFSVRRASLGVAAALSPWNSHMGPSHQLLQGPVAWLQPPSQPTAWENISLFPKSLSFEVAQNFYDNS